MQQWFGRWRKSRGWHDSLEEIRRFLDTWYFYISISGDLYVRPRRQAVTRRDVHAFLRRLDVLGKHTLPETITFDFTRTRMTPRRWHRIREILRRYAERSDSVSFITFDKRQCGGIAVILQSIGRFRQLSQI